MVRGMLIVVEGLDRAGKSTQCERLAANLEKAEYDIKRMRFPGKYKTFIRFHLEKALMLRIQIDLHLLGSL